MSKTKKFRRYLIWTFWLGILGIIGLTAFYVDRRIPDQLSMVAGEQEELNLALPFEVTLLSESEEVMLGNQ